MQIKITAQKSIAALPPAVFTYLTELKYHQLWNPHLHAIAPILTLERGATYKTTSILLGVKVSSMNKVSEYVKNQLVEIENSTGLLRYRVRYALEKHEGKTLLQCVTTVATDGELFGFTAPVLKLLARRELQSDLDALKIAVEQKLT